MKVLCISAKARHGKDTAADIIKNYLESAEKNVLIIHYADLVKFVCTKFFNWDGKKDEKGRSLLQYVGTDKVGAVDPAYWVNFIVSILRIFKNEWDFVLIPDCRYPVEFEKMSENFSTALLRIERPNFDNGLTEEQKQHPSEVSFDNYSFAYTIYNDGSIKDFEKKLISFSEGFLLG